MITRFQITGANAGRPKMLYELRMPVTTPVKPRITTIGNMIWVSDTTRLLLTPRPGTNTCMNSGAASMNTAETAPSTIAVIQITMLATRQASASPRVSRSSTNTGTNAALIALSATRLRTRLGTLKAITNAL